MSHWRRTVTPLLEVLKCGVGARVLGLEGYHGIVILLEIGAAL